MEGKKSEWHCDQQEGAGLTLAELQQSQGLVWRKLPGWAGQR